MLPTSHFTEDPAVAVREIRLPQLHATVWLAEVYTVIDEGDRPYRNAWQIDARIAFDGRPGLHQVAMGPPHDLRATAIAATIEAAARILERSSPIDPSHGFFKDVTAAGNALLRAAAPNSVPAAE